MSTVIPECKAGFLLPNQCLTCECKLAVELVATAKLCRVHLKLLSLLNVTEQFYIFSVVKIKISSFMGDKL